MTSSAARRSRAQVASSKPTREASRALLRDDLKKAFDVSGVHHVSVPAPVAPADTLLRAFPGLSSIYWKPADGSAFAGLGETLRIEPESDKVVGAFQNLRRHGAGHTRLFGGFAFSNAATDQAPWARFGRGFFVLPRWTYEVAEDATLSIAFDATAHERVDAILDEFDAIWDSLERPLGVLPPVLQAERVGDVGRDAWCEQVEAIRREIDGGAVQKVVAARHCVIELDRAGRALDVLHRLESRFPACTCFAVWQGDAVFIGATPELLVSKHAGDVRSEALAGSTTRGDEERLLSSPKERDEHQLVVDAIVDALAPFCSTVDAAPEPAIRELRNLIHMQTPIRGCLQDDVHILELARALHPTPAVGGVPTREAVAWILAHESADRGWYSAPVGWIDPEGDGEFAVALRSGVLRENLAWVYAGAGIMSDSDPLAEYDETELKMQALLGALHGDTG